MSINFPNTPNIGDQWPVPPQAGLPVYQWDGEKWTAGPPNIPDGLVHYDIAQNLTTAQRVQARSNTHAATIDALSYNGMQVNGNMDISQERGTTTTSTNGACSLDGWWFYYTGTMVCGSGQYTNLITSGYPSNNALLITVGTAEASLAAADYTCLVHRIEGYRVLRLRWGTPQALPITLGFWTGHSTPGLYTGSIRNSDGSRSYAFTYTQNASAIMEYKTVTIPGCTDGTWKYDNTVGLQVTLCMACGTTNVTATPNTWITSNVLGAAGQVNGVATTSGIFRLTGFIVLPGSDAPTAERAPYIMRPADQELQTCLRYYEKISNVAQQSNGTGQSIFLVMLKVMKRAGPTMTILTPPSYASSSAASIWSSDANMFGVQWSSAGSGGWFNGMVVQADARI